MTLLLLLICCGIPGLRDLSRSHSWEDSKEILIPILPYFLLFFYFPLGLRCLVVFLWYGLCMQASKQLPARLYTPERWRHGLLTA